MRVEQVMSRHVQTCGPLETLERAAQLMWDSDCGGLPVCQGDGSRRVVGFITDRDIAMSAMFKNEPLRELRVSDAMSHEVRAVRPHDSLADAETAMTSARIRRLPVLDDNDQLVGLISIADLAQEATRERGANMHDITETEIGNTLAAICLPSKPRIAA